MKTWSVNPDIDTFESSLDGALFFLSKYNFWNFLAELEEFRTYLEKRFDFEQVTVKKFRTWAERRQFNRDMKRKQAESERPILPANQKLITLSVQDAPTKKGSGSYEVIIHSFVTAGLLRKPTRTLIMYAIKRASLHLHLIDIL